MRVAVCQRVAEHRHVGKAHLVCEDVNRVDAVARLQGALARHGGRLCEEELPEMPELVYINLRHNNLDSIENAVKIFQFPKLVDLNVVNNPIDLNASSFNLLMAEFILKRSAMVRFCKITVKESNKLEAVHLAQYRW